jgi:hypothetical protein
MSYHLLTLRTTCHEFTDDCCDRRQPERARRRTFSTLERRGYRVTLEAVADRVPSLTVGSTESGDLGGSQRAHSARAGLSLGGLPDTLRLHWASPCDQLVRCSRRPGDWAAAPRGPEVGSPRVPVTARICTTSRDTQVPHQPVAVQDRQPADTVPGELLFRR